MVRDKVMFKRRLFNWFGFLLLGSLLSAAVLQPAVGESSSGKRVLLIHSNHPEYPTTFDQIDGVTSALAAAGFERPELTLDIEFMDSKRFYSEALVDAFFNRLALKLAKLPSYDLIMTADDNATKSAIERQGELFGDTPLVFSGVNDVEFAIEQDKNPMVTGGIEKISVIENLELAARLAPDQPLLFVVGASPSAQAVLTAFRKEASEALLAVTQVMSLTDLSFDELKTRLKTFPVDSSLLYLNVIRDKSGANMSFHDSFKMVDESFAGRIYHPMRPGIGEGILLGGIIVSHNKQGRAAGAMAAQILQGRSPALIPVMQESPNIPLFDYRLVREYGIPRGDLPAGIRYVNEPVGRVPLTLEEREWLDAHPKIVLGTDRDWKPYVYTDEAGKVTGIEPDLITRINALAGTNIRLKVGEWSTLLEQARAREIDGFAVSARHAERAAHFLFTDSSYKISKYIYTDSKKIRRMEDLANRRVGLGKGNRLEEKLLREIPGIVLVPAESDDALISLLISGEVDALISGIRIRLAIQEKLLPDIRLAFIVPDSETRILYSIRKDWPQLHSIINKALAEIPQGERLAILEKWGDAVVSRDERTSILRWELKRNLMGKQKVALQLKWKHQFQFAGFYAALEKGFYDEAGLEVSIIEGGPGIDFIDAVLSGKAQYGVEMPTLMLRRAQGDPVVVLASIFQYTPLSLISLAKKNIRTPQDLIGRNIMIRSDSDASLRAMISKEDVDLATINIIPHSFDLEDLIQGKTDAMSLYVTDTPAEFAKRGLAFNAMVPQDYGVKFYGDSLFTTEDQIRNHPGQVEMFRQASLKGWEYAMQHPEEIARIIHEKYAPHQSVEALISEAEQMKALLLHEVIGIGHMNPYRWKQIRDTFIDQGMLSADFSLEGFIYEPPVMERRVVLLNDEERFWLKEHPLITLVTGLDWKPFTFRDEKTGEPRGFHIDYMALLNKKLGGVIKVKMFNWATALQMTMDHKVDGIFPAAISEERKPYLMWSDIFSSSPLGLLTANDAPKIEQWSDLSGKKIAIAKGTTYVELMGELEPGAEVILTDSVLEQLQGLVEGKVNAIFNSAPVLYNQMQEHNLTTLLKFQKLYYSPNHGNARIAVRNNAPLILSIINKGISSITDEEINAIKSKWMPTVLATTDSEAPAIDLTGEERAWLDANHTVRVRVGNYPPYMLSKPTPSGMSVDYLNAIAKHLGFKVEFIPDTLDWPASTQDVMGERRHYDLLLTMTRSPEREQQFALTKDYLSAPWVIYARQNSPYIIGLDSLNGKIVAAEKGYVITKKLKADYPAIRILEVASSVDALAAVATGQANAYVGNLANASYLIKQQQLNNLVVAAPTQYGINLQAMAVRKDWSVLAGMIDKGLAALTAEERHDISQKWGVLEVRPRIDYALIWKVSLGFLLILMAVLVWNHIIRRQKLAISKSEAELQKNKNRLQMVLEKMPAVVIIKDLELRHQFVNSEFEYILQMKREDVLSKTDYEIFPREVAERIQEEDLKAIKLKKNIQVWTDVPHPDGSMHEFFGNKTPILDEQGHVVELLIVSHDTNERKLHEVELKKAKETAEAANQAKSTFLANMSHELRTPLNAILGFSEMLGRDSETSADQRAKITTINRSGEHLLAMINDVLDLAKIEAGRVELEPEAIELPQLLEDVGRMFEVRAESSGLRFNLEIDPKISRFIKADPGKLRQILINLLGNAVKFTREGGVALRARTLSVTGDPAMVTLQLEVEDSGPGIFAEQLQHIFEPFVQAGHSSSNTEGTGLGLAIVKSFIGLMGGEIGVESEMGKGSLFHIKLPVVLADAAETTGVEAARPAVLGLAPEQTTWRILVVEDILENRLLLTSLLVQVGFTVREAEDGEEAVTLFKQWQPHFIWMDMRMPVMDGYEATRQIRRLPGGDTIKIVAITASAFREERERILKAGCNEIVHKPFHSYEVFDMMAEQLGVDYIYEKTIKTKTTAITLTVEMLAALPDDLRTTLRKTASELDLQATHKVIEEIRSDHPKTADALRKLVQDFDFGQILDLLGGKT